MKVGDTGICACAYGGQTDAHSQSDWQKSPAVKQFANGIREAVLIFDEQDQAAMRKQQIAVEVSSVIRASPDSFRIAWTERHYENGQLSTTERWTAILTIAVQPPRDAERLKANPLGIYVNAISWSREIGQ